MLRKLDMAKPARIEANKTGELISIDTFYVRCPKGIIRLYKLTATDCYSSFTLAHLYTEKSAKM
jgi:hypothetical protein